MRLIAAMLLPLMACAWPVEQHGGLSGVPAPADIVFIGAGAGIHAGLLGLKVKPFPRFIADVTFALAVRTWKPLGRSEGSHILFIFGAGVTEWGSWFICSGPCHRDD